MKLRYIFFYAVGSERGNAIIDLKWKERPSDAENVEFIESKISKAVKHNVVLTGWRRLWK